MCLANDVGNNTQIRSELRPGDYKYHRAIANNVQLSLKYLATSSILYINPLNQTDGIWGCRTILVLSLGTLPISKPYFEVVLVILALLDVVDM
jgi:hypothetical protein